MPLVLSIAFLLTCLASLELQNLTPEELQKSKFLPELFYIFFLVCLINKFLIKRYKVNILTLLLTNYAHSFDLSSVRLLNNCCSSKSCIV